MSAIPADLWHPETVYLNTASFGLPPDPAWDALQQAQEDWRAGRVSWEHWTAVTDRARAEFARLVAPTPSTSRSARTIRAHRAGRGRAARRHAGARARARVHSLLFPFLAQAERGVTVDGRAARQARGTHRREHRRRRGLRGAVLDGQGRRPRGSGRRAPPRRADGDRRHARDRLAAARRPRFDAVACAAYKWLMSPRGTAFMVLSAASRNA